MSLVCAHCGRKESLDVQLCSQCGELFGEDGLYCCSSEPPLSPLRSEWSWISEKDDFVAQDPSYPSGANLAGESQDDEEFRRRLDRSRNYGREELRGYPVLTGAERA